jgi:RNA-directed DNA polymerase
VLNEDVMGQVLDPENVSRAYEQVKRNDGAPGVDGMSVAAYAEHAAHHWPALRRSYGKGPTDLERCAA